MTSINVQTSSWPSRRLWLKLIVSFLYAPFLISIGLALLAAVFAIGIVSGGMSMFGGGTVGVLGGCIALLGLGLVASGPFFLGILLSRLLRGVVAGGLALISMIVSWMTAGYMVVASNAVIDEALTFWLIAGIGVSAIELITRDVHDRGGVAGLGIGILVGFLFSFIYANLFFPYQLRIDFPRDFRSLSIVLAWSNYFALVWLSALFFPELFTRRVGRGGVIAWAGLTGSVFAISFLLLN